MSVVALCSSAAYIILRAGIRKIDIHGLNFKKNLQRSYVSVEDIIIIVKNPKKKPCVIKEKSPALSIRKIDLD